MDMSSKGIENIVGEVKNAGNQHMLRFSQKVSSSRLFDLGLWSKRLRKLSGTLHDI